MGKEQKKPEWAPKDSGNEFASYVLPPVVNTGIKPEKPQKIKKPVLSLDDYVNGVLDGDRTVLARAITLIESTSSSHLSKARQLLNSLLPCSGKSVRIAITGAPGAGKSTFIEAFGSYLCDLGHRVAVLAIDPSSNRSKGSILGDKTRMETLSRNPDAFIRPSPSGGTLGGVASKTGETIILCEAAGFDIILIETVGVGQSEVAARSIADFFLLVLLPDEGDELQGMKKGSVELADAIIINKADGSQLQHANITRANYEQAVHYLMPATEGWFTKVLTVSSVNHSGLDTLMETIDEFCTVTRASGVFDNRRKQQSLDWFKRLTDDKLRDFFQSEPEIKKLIKENEKCINEEKITPAAAAEVIVESFIRLLKKK